MSENIVTDFRNRVDTAISDLREAGKSGEISYLDAIIESMVWMREHLHLGREEKRRNMHVFYRIVLDDYEFSESPLGKRLRALVAEYIEGVF